MNLKELARHNKTSELLELVESKQYQDQYEAIKYYSEDKIRKEIARQGYFPEDYLNDSSMDIRLVVLEEHEEYVPQLMEVENFGTQRSSPPILNITKIQTLNI